MGGPRNIFNRLMKYQQEYMYRVQRIYRFLAIAQNGPQTHIKLQTRFFITFSSIQKGALQDMPMTNYWEIAEVLAFLGLALQRRVSRAASWPFEKQNGVTTPRVPLTKLQETVNK